METLIAMIPMILILGVFYMMVFIPEKKRKKKYDAMLNELKVNDEVMTRGGIIGKIISIEEDKMVLESGPERTRIRFSKSAIADKIAK